MDTRFASDVVDASSFAIRVEAKQDVSTCEVTERSKRALHIRGHEIKGYPQSGLVGYIGPMASIQGLTRRTVEILGGIWQSGGHAIWRGRLRVASKATSV